MPRDLGPLQPTALALDRTTEWVIAGCRLTLALGGLLAIYLDPSQPTQGDVGYLFLLAYVGFALVMLAVASFETRARATAASRQPLHVIAHSVELILVCLIISYTEGPSSPFFVFFSFVMLTATLRWQAIGALITGLLLALVLLTLTTGQLVMSVSHPELDRLVVRNVYILVASVLFALLGTQLLRSQQRLERLRIAGKLHDETLQVLTAAKLSLNSINDSLGADTRARLLQVVTSLENEQRSIRRFVDNAGSDPEEESALLDRPAHLTRHALDALRTRLQTQWGCDVVLSAAALADVSLSAQSCNAILAILSEGVANAVVHGQANHIEITATLQDRMLHIDIQDNGRGFASAAVEGCATNVVSIRPRSIQSHVDTLRGTLAIESSARSTRLHIKIPI